MALDIPAIRRQFPFLRESRGGTPPVYLDNAATSQKPDAVIESLSSFYASGPGNVHRGLHRQAEQATENFEAARSRIRAFIKAQHDDEIIFTKSATEAINLAAHGWARANMQAGDIIALPVLEHHSNIVPWLQLREETGIDMRWIDIGDDGSIRMDELDAALKTSRVKLVTVSGQSNVLGTRPPVAAIANAAHDAGAIVLMDATQLAAHAPIDVAEIDCDMLALSGHKLYGPGGIGVLFAKRGIQKYMRPFLGGGGMVREVRRDGFIPADAPARFEAGTPPTGDAIGFAAALEWQGQFAWNDRIAHEKTLIAASLSGLKTISGLRILGTGDPESTFGCISFTIEGIHPHDLTDLLGERGFALRAGHHCAGPLHERLRIPASARMSFGLYNTTEEIAACIAAIEEIRNFLRK